MARNKLSEKDKKLHIGITLHPDIYFLLENEAKNNNKSRSELISSIMNEHFKNKFVNNN